MPYALLADALLLVHFGLALFLVLGLVLVLLGGALGWKFVRTPWLRIVHLAAMGVILLESAAGWFCPLTRWEYELRRMAGTDPRYAGDSFMQYWAERIFYHNWDERVFLALYAAFFVLMLAALFLVPMRRPPRSGKTCRPEENNTLD